MSQSVVCQSLKLLVAIVLILTAPQAFAVEFNDFIISYWCGPPSGGNYDA